MNTVAFIVNVYEEPTMEISNIVRNPDEDDIDELVDICFEKSNEEDDYFIIHLREDQIKMLEHIVNSD